MARTTFSEFTLIMLFSGLLVLIWNELHQIKLNEKKTTIIKKTVVQINSHTYEYDRYSPLIFISGIGNSGQGCMKLNLNIFFCTKI
jgi:hypothetical protein